MPATQKQSIEFHNQANAYLMTRHLQWEHNKQTCNTLGVNNPTLAEASKVASARIENFARCNGITVRYYNPDDIQF